MALLIFVYLTASLITNIPPIQTKKTRFIINLETFDDNSVVVCIINKNEEYVGFEFSISLAANELGE